MAVTVMTGMLAWTPREFAIDFYEIQIEDPISRGCRLPFGWIRAISALLWLRCSREA
jgi:hypothetical protein